MGKITAGIRESKPALLPFIMNIKGKNWKAIRYITGR